MALSEQDREWVRAIVTAAIAEMAEQTQEGMRKVVEHHAENCPNMMQGKGVLIGLVLGAAIVGSGLSVGFAKLLQLLN